MVYETVRSVLFYLDTRVRSSGTIGAPRFTFPNNLIGIKPQQGEKIRLTMQEASIEYTFYQTESFNNKVYVKETLDGQLNNRVITIPIGNYNLVTFVVELTRQLNDGSLYTYTVDYIPETNQLRFIATPPPFTPLGTVAFIFDSEIAFAETGVALNESLNEMMGFLISSIAVLTPSPAGTSLECTSAVPVTMSPGVENLYVTVQNSCSNYGNANISNTFSASNILAKIPVSNPPFSTLFFYDLNSNFSTIIDNKYIDNLNLILFNERFTPIEPRKNWTFTIKIDIIRGRAENQTAEALSELVELEKMKLLRKENIAKKNKNNNPT